MATGRLSRCDFAVFHFLSHVLANIEHFMVWEVRFWQYDLPQNLFGLGMGSVQLLDNGNYSIYTYGNGLGQAECSIFESHLMEIWYGK